MALMCFALLTTSDIGAIEFITDGEGSACLVWVT